VDRVTWLEQRLPSPGVILLRDYPAGEVVRVTCRRCDRAGQYRLAGLVERFGPAAGLPDVLEALAADCPQRDVNRFGDPCGAWFADLWLDDGRLPRYLRAFPICIPPNEE
jgi:hypothetical protein